MLTLSYFHRVKDWLEDKTFSCHLQYVSAVNYYPYLLIVMISSQSQQHENKKNALIKSFSNIFFTHSDIERERVRANNGNDCQRDKIGIGNYAGGGRGRRWDINKECKLRKDSQKNMVDVDERMRWETKTIKSAFIAASDEWKSNAINKINWCFFRLIASHFMYFN